MSRGRGGGFSRGAGRPARGGYQQRDMGPPDQVLEMGSFVHAVEDEMLCSSLMADKVPYFNAPIYLQNKSVIGKVDEILGPINEVYFSVKMGEGMVASSFKKGDKVYIGGDKLLPIERFLPKPKMTGVNSKTSCIFQCHSIDISSFSTYRAWSRPWRSISKGWAWCSRWKRSLSTWWCKGRRPWWRKRWFRWAWWWWDLVWWRRRIWWWRIWWSRRWSRKRRLPWVIAPFNRYSVILNILRTPFMPLSSHSLIVR
ncbi:Gar1/Naf1 RNA binding region-domain-containing protein [Cyathus striatus]|nr:Gar1/Naf1 RNA binding region-domain-containing protein [Cyathus striatus]